MSRLPFPNFTNQQFGYGNSSQNQLFPRPLPPPPAPPEFMYQQRMLPPPQSEYYMPPPPPPSLPPPPLNVRVPPPALYPPRPPHPSIGTAQTVVSGHQDIISSNQEERQYCLTNVVDHQCDKSFDQNWICKWLNGIPTKKKDPVKASRPTCSIKVYEVKDKISNILQSIKELENSARILCIMMKSVDEKEWNRKCEEIEKKKSELHTKLQGLHINDSVVRYIQDKLTKRKKKRERLKRQAVFCKKTKEEAIEKRKRLHRQIDAWLNEMEESVERSRREEELKLEADAVLSGVTLKKAEARKQISLLTALLQLRQARVTALAGTGKKVSQIQIATFNTVIEKLKAMWTKQLDEYLLEEQGLRVMLSESEVDKKYTEQSHEKQIYHQWETAIFGSDNNCKGEPRNQEEFIEIRRIWDQFVVNERTVMASSVPTGWVLPTPPSDDVWSQQLKSSK